MTTVWMTVTGCTSYAIYIHFKSKNILIYVCGILIERHCFKIFELLIRSISQYLAATFSYFKAMIDNMVLNSDPYLIWYAPLASSASSSVLPLYPSSLLLFFLSADSGCSSTVRMSNSCVLLCIYAFQWKVHEMHLCAISDNWFIMKRMQINDKPVLWNSSKVHLFLCYIFCTVHWADLTWFTFHCWLYSVSFSMWRIKPWNLYFHILMALTFKRWTNDFE